MRYSYKAKNFKGEERAGEMDAENLRDLGNLLRADGYVLVSAHAAGIVEGRGAEALFRRVVVRLNNLSLFHSVPLVDRMTFSRNLAVMVGAGLSISRALEALEREAKNKYFRLVIHGIGDSVKKGMTLKESFASCPNVFSPLYLAMVEAGEKSGKLAESLNVLARQMHADHELVRRVRSAFIYPAIVLVVMICIAIAMLVYVVPVLLSTFKELGVELPVTTRAIVAVSEFLLNNYILASTGTLLAAIGLGMFFRSKPGKRVLDFSVIHIPVIGTMNHKFNTARTARTLSSLLSSGVAIADALDITARVIQNHYYSGVLLEAKEKIQKGETMSSVFAKYPRLYSSLLDEMVSVGEETGKIVGMLEEVATFYEAEVEAATKDLSSVVEPFLMVIIGGGVGFFAVSMIQPLYSVMGGI